MQHHKFLRSPGHSLQNYCPTQRREYAAAPLIRAGLVSAAFEAHVAWLTSSLSARDCGRCEQPVLSALPVPRASGSGVFSRRCLSFTVRLEFHSVLRSSASILPTCVFPDSSTSLLCVCACVCVCHRTYSFFCVVLLNCVLVSQMFYKFPRAGIAPLSLMGPIQRVFSNILIGSSSLCSSPSL